MHLYEVSTTSSAALAIFAESYEHAARIFMAHWMTCEKGDLPDLEIKQRNAAWPGINREALADALALKISGIGRLDPDQGWTIVPPGDAIEEEDA